MEFLPLRAWMGRQIRNGRLLREVDSTERLDVGGRGQGAGFLRQKSSYLATSVLDIAIATKRRSLPAAGKIFTPTPGERHPRSGEAAMHFSGLMQAK
jgi:hypothetical protein